MTEPLARYRRMRFWLQRPWDQCRHGHSMWTKGGYTICRKHGEPSVP